MQEEGGDMKPTKLEQTIIKYRKTMTQIEIAKMLGFSRSKVGEIERNARFKSKQTETK